jgi:replicative DNA helicase
MTYSAPHDSDAEMMVLAAGLESAKWVGEARELLRPEAFYSNAHRTVYEALIALHTQERSTDTVAVTEWLMTHRLLEDVGGPVAIHDLASRHLSGAQARSAIRIVADMAARRTVVDAMRDTAKLLSAEAKLAETVDRLVAKVTSTLPAGQTVDPTELSLEFYERLEGHTVQAFRTGLKQLDDKFTLPRGMLTIITGLPGSGKSTFLDWLVHRYATQDANVVFFSPEQGPPARHLIGLVHTRLGFDPVGSPRRDEIEDARAWWLSRVSWIQDDRDNTASAVLAIARARAAKGANLLIIDPYNNMSPDEKYDRQDLYIQDLLRKVKRFARETNMAVVIVAHPRSVPLINGTESVYRVPTAGDISGGQEWWNHADLIATVWRNQSGEQPERFGDAQQVDLVVQKVRDAGRTGRIGRVPFYFDTEKRQYGLMGAV